MKTEKNRFLSIVSAVAFGATIAVNALAELLPIGGKTTGEISDIYPSLLSPAGYAFMIWGLIYALVGWFVVYQLLPKNLALAGKTAVLFSLSCVFNIVWLLAWHAEEILVSFIAIVALLCTLGFLAKVVQAEKWFVRLAFDIYFGWITAATAASLFSTLTYFDPAWFDAKPVQALAVVVLLAVTLFAIINVVRAEGYAYSSTVAWAIIGIIIKHLLPEPDGYAGRYLVVCIFAILALIALVTMIITTAVRSRKK